MWKGTNSLTLRECGSQLLGSEAGWCAQGDQLVQRVLSSRVLTEGTESADSSYKSLNRELVKRTLIWNNLEQLEMCKYSTYLFLIVSMVNTVVHSPILPAALPAPSESKCSILPSGGNVGS